MEPYQARVMQEKEELDNNRGKLTTFFSTDIYENLPQEEKDDMKEQLIHMTNYSNVLRRRIDRF